MNANCRQCAVAVKYRHVQQTGQQYSDSRQIYIRHVIPGIMLSRINAVNPPTNTLVIPSMFSVSSIDTIPARNIAPLHEIYTAVTYLHKKTNILSFTYNIMCVHKCSMHYWEDYKLSRMFSGPISVQHKLPNLFSAGTSHVHFVQCLF